MAERTNARLLKSREVQASVGSNPTPSAGQGPIPVDTPSDHAMTVMGQIGPRQARHHGLRTLNRW
jgi:hypothetical protein